MEAEARGQKEEELRILEALSEGGSFPVRPSDGGKGVGGETFFRTNEGKLNALLDATQRDMEKAEHAVLRRADDQYRQIIFDAQVYANTGAGTVEKAVDMATKDFLARGIDSIVYRNGARHTISDYADMAIRTAERRAYLAGAGQKRQEWGLSLVIVNRRGTMQGGNFGHACPHCIPWLGKVLIDDVYSDGKPDGVHPLLSEAMAAGFLHPRCKDGFTTYFPGISTAPDPATKQEVAQAVENEREENRERYAQRQAEKYERLSKYSLDPGNRRRYEARAEEWKEKTLVKSDESGILNEKDENAIKQYMTAESYSLNAALRNPDTALTKKQQKLVENLDAALDKLPDYSGRVYRSVSTDMVSRDEFMAQYAIGKPTLHRAYTSTGKSVYDESMGIQMVIDVKHGKDISRWNANEQEVLLRRGTWLIPTSIDGNTIYLEEYP